MSIPNMITDAKKSLAIAATLLLLTGTWLPALGGNVRGGWSGSLPQIIEELPESPLSEDEKAGILLMREEEKLARDMYAALYERWNVPIFNNIARSEQGAISDPGFTFP